MSRTPKGMLIALALLSMAALMACQPQHSPQEGVPAATGASDMRTNVVPLVRRMEPSAAGPIELEFDVPAQPDDDTPPVFVGVRLSGTDPTAVANAADRLQAANVSARLHLVRFSPSGSTEVQLMRIRSAPEGKSELVALTPDGLAPGLFLFDADTAALQAAGLRSEGRSDQALAFAYTPGLPAGRYRLVLDSITHREALVEANAELLVAYTSKGK